MQSVSHVIPQRLLPTFLNLFVVSAFASLDTWHTSFGAFDATLYILLYLTLHHMILYLHFTLKAVRLYPLSLSCVFMFVLCCVYVCIMMRVFYPSIHPLSVRHHLVLLRVAEGAGASPSRHHREAGMPLCHSLLFIMPPFFFHPLHLVLPSEFALHNVTVSCLLTMEVPSERESFLVLYIYVFGSEHIQSRDICVCCASVLT